jgi:hypothetical protein
MADSPQDLLSNPEFQKLSPEAQHIVISTKFPEYAKLSPEAQKIVLSKAAPADSAATPAEKEYRPSFFAGVSGAPPTMAEMDPQQIAAYDERERQKIVKGAPIVASAASAGMPMLARMGVTGSAAGLSSLLTGGSTEEAGANIRNNAVLPELGGSALAKTGQFLGKAASHSLARILRLTPKSFQFGREPAQEVLESGLATGSLAGMAKSIEQASKETTADLNSALQSTRGTVNAENHAIDIANSLPGAMGNRFLKVVDDAAAKLGFRSNQLSNLTAGEANALKMEVARQARFVEGEARQSVASAGKAFGGKVKDSLVGLNPDVKDLLDTSANLTEASKGANFAIRAEKAGQGKSGLAGFDAKKPVTYARPVTDTTVGTQTLFKVAQALKDTVGTSNALRM